MIPSNSSAELLPAQRRFICILGSFIIVLSFLYGFVKGSRTIAQASGAPAVDSGTQAVAPRSVPQHVRALLPKDAQLGSMGNDLAINGVPAEMLSFVVERDLSSFVFELQTLWRVQGLEPQQHSSDRRAISFAMNKSSGRRVSLVVWEVPESLRAAIGRDSVDSGSSQESLLQGTLSVLEAGHERKYVPGFPVMPDAVVGSLVASTDLERRTFTGSYSNPGIVAESIDFYDHELAVAGWQLLAGPEAEVLSERRYRRGVQELILVFGALPQLQEIGGPVLERTMMTAVLSVPLNAEAIDD